MLSVVLIEDNLRLNEAVKVGLEKTGECKIVFSSSKGEDAVNFLITNNADVILADVELAGNKNGIETIIEIRKFYPRKPSVIYSIQDEDSYFRKFRNSGILSHYAYVKKSNYLLPEMILPLLKDAVEGKSFIDPEIESRVEEVAHEDKNSPLSLLEPIEKQVVQLIAMGFSNEQIANRLGYKDKRTVSRINGQIYSVWDLDNSTEDEKTARTRAAIITRENKLLTWEEDGKAYYKGTNDEWILWKP
jgi:DNA-binding NarL/FixJ family response regulator